MLGISPPEKSHPNGQAIGELRRQEIAHLLDIEKQLHDITRGVGGPGASFSTEDDVAADVEFSQLIEFPETDSERLFQFPSIGKMLDNIDDIQRYEALERLLRLQKLYLMAEQIILGLNLTEIDEKPLDMRWFNRWKSNACEISNGELQQLWARILVQELRHTGSCSLRVLGDLSEFSIKDAENLSKLASWTIGDFVYRSALQALTGRFDSKLFETLEENGIVRGVFGKVLSKTLHSEVHHGFLANLVLADKKLKLTSTQPRTELHVPAYKLTSVGRELLPLVTSSVDQEYLNHVLQDLHARGISVSIVDIVPDSSTLQLS